MSRNSVVILTAVLAVAVFALAGFFYNRNGAEVQNRAVAEASHLVRPHSPVLGRPDAPVTIVEFFDPSCETCRAFYPIVKDILKKYPDDVRLVLRYAPFHEGSDDAVKILETARLQNKFEPVLDALIETQPEWAIHGAPNLRRAMDAATAAGLDEEQSRRDVMKPEIDAALKQDVEDIRAANVQRTPTFFVNGKPLPKFGVQELKDLVQAEVERSRRSAASQ